jgi:uncharacterized protein
MNSVAVAFSGGVDSTFLLKTARDVLADRVLAVTARSSTYPAREFESAMRFINSNQIRHEIIISEELEIEGFSRNPIDRCYYCKLELFKKIKKTAAKYSIMHAADGSNADDEGDFRPGMRALRELGILSPLKAAGLSKQEIRLLSKEMGLMTWDKPAMACLASRFPYGNEITGKKLEMIDRAELVLLENGFKQVRVRHHGEIARIEVAREEMHKFNGPDVMITVHDELLKLGFKYVCLDLKGYRTGSMNEVLTAEQKGSVK